MLDIRIRSRQAGTEAGAQDNLQERQENEETQGDGHKQILAADEDTPPGRDTLPGRPDTSGRWIPDPFIRRSADRRSEIPEEAGGPRRKFRPEPADRGSVDRDFPLRAATRP